jgi:hypothetical protein
LETNKHWRTSIITDIITTTHITTITSIVTTTTTDIITAITNTNDAATGQQEVNLFFIYFKYGITLSL